MIRGVATVLTVTLGLVTLVATPASAHEVAQLPSGNLIASPWLSKVVNGQLKLDTTGWVFEGSPTWGTGNAKPDCPGPAPFATSFTLRWARQAGQIPEFYPNIEVRVHTVVAANSAHRTVKFFMHWVMHRMTLKAVVYGGASPNGPWTQVWTAFDHTETVDFRPSPGEPRSEAWQHFTSLPGMFDDWFAPVPRTTVLPQGYPYYRVQLRASYPNPDNTASGAVGGKVTGLYFTTAP
ncbi:MAG TPA: hypothetical protein VFC19_45465 [Candidatus Limnocylindrales bacterium]|nr:hypothetical protein [Candidatus Limnocylindrales bacterium]